MVMGKGADEGRRTVKVRRKTEDSTHKAARSGQTAARRYTPAQLQQLSLGTLLASSGGIIAAAAAAAGVSRCSDAQHHSDRCLGRHDLEVLLHDKPVRDFGVVHFVPELVQLRKAGLLLLLESLGQEVSKQNPTRLELLGAAVTLLCSTGKLSA